MSKQKIPPPISKGLFATSLSICLYLVTRLKLDLNYEMSIIRIIKPVDRQAEA